MAPRANWKGFSEARPRGRSASFTAMHTSAIGPGVAICTIDLKGPVLENRVFAAIEQVMLEPGKLRECMDYFKEDHRDAGESIEKELRAIDGRLADLEMKKQRVIDVDLSGDLSPRCCCSSAGEIESPLTSHRPDEPGCKARSATLLRSAKCASINAGFPEVHLNLRLTAMTHV